MALRVSDLSPSSAGGEPRSSGSTRLFQNDFLERLTHVHPAIPLLIWGPVVVYLFFRAGQEGRLGPVLFWIGSGLFAWTLAEYLIHRFLFHFTPQSPVGKRLVFLFHGIHHHEPQDPTRLVMPPIVSLALGGSLYFLFSNLLPPSIFFPTFGGFVLGYLGYDYLHFAAHHFQTRNRILNHLRRHHLQHHFRDDHRQWGVSSPLWDWVFGTGK